MAARSEDATVVGRLSVGLRWQIYADGVVVLVPSTCETHVLASALAPMFERDALLICDPDQDDHVSFGPQGWTPAGVVLQEALFKELTALRVIEPLRKAVAAAT